MSLDADVDCIRSRVALSAPGYACVQLRGKGGHELLDRVSPRPLFVRSGQMLHTVLLADDATPVADVYLCCDDDGYYVIADGLTAAATIEYLDRHRANLEVECVDLDPTHAMISLDGPYAWELIAELTTPDVIGLPYLSFFHDRRLTCFRGGKTGEYGYDLLVECARLQELRDEIAKRGSRFDLRTVDQHALDVAGLEAGFFNVRRWPRPGLTPIELQLQWRIASNRTCPGAAALAEHRAAPRGRVTSFASASELASDAVVELAGRPVGRILDACRSPTRREWIGVALLELAVAHPGLDFASGAAKLRTISSPAVNNRSLYVDPQRHTWDTRETEQFPSLVRPSWS